MIHLQQWGSTSSVETQKLKDGELDQLLEEITKEASRRNQTRQEKIDKLKIEQVEFLTKYRTLTKTMIPGTTKIDINKPLEREYQLLESVMSNL